MVRERLKSIGVIALWLLFSQACTTVDIQRPPTTLDPQARWVLLPIVNYTQTPQAGLRAEAIIESLVRSRGVWDLKRYPSKLNTESLFEPAERNAVEKAMQWAQNLEVDYALTGTVDEWRYKVGVDGEPAVGFSLQLIEMRTGRVVWSAVGSKTGWSREALSAVAQKLLRQLTQPLALSRAINPVADKQPNDSKPVKPDAKTATKKTQPARKPITQPGSKSVADQAPSPSLNRPSARPFPDTKRSQTSAADTGARKAPVRPKLPFPHRAPRPGKPGG